jgi:hypothetical protein
VTRKYWIVLGAGLILLGIPAAWIATSPGLSRSALYATPGADLGTLNFPPIYVLENGTADKADDDVARQKFLVAHVREVWLAINRGGADVRSYIHWSLFDNFEWAEGFDARFGLMTVDYEHGFGRKARPSAKLYSEIAGTNTLPASLMLRYGGP